MEWFKNFFVSKIKCERCEDTGLLVGRHTIRTCYLCRDLNQGTKMRRVILDALLAGTLRKEPIFSIYDLR